MRVHSVFDLKGTPSLRHNFKTTSIGNDVLLNLPGPAAKDDLCMTDTPLRTVYSIRQTVWAGPGYANDKGYNILQKFLFL